MTSHQSSAVIGAATRVQLIHTGNHWIPRNGVMMRLSAPMTTTVDRPTPNAATPSGQHPLRQRVARSVVVSEPLGDLEGAWNEVPEGTWVSSEKARTNSTLSDHRWPHWGSGDIPSLQRVGVALSIHEK